MSCRSKSTAQYLTNLYTRLAARYLSRLTRSTGLFISVPGSTEPDPQRAQSVEELHIQGMLEPVGAGKSSEPNVGEGRCCCGCHDMERRREGKLGRQLANETCPHQRQSDPR